MLPILIDIGAVRIHTFGVMVVLGFALGIWWCSYEARRLGVERDRIFDLTFWLLVSGILGARLLYLIVNSGDYLAWFSSVRASHDVVTACIHLVIEFVAVWRGGLVWYGGLLAAFMVGVLYLRRHRMPLWPTADLVAPGVMLGLAVGRLGCLAAGDDHGKVVEGAWRNVQAGLDAPWWTLTFHNSQSLIPMDLLGKPLYPTQPIMSLYCILIFGFLFWLRGRKQFHGQIVWVMMLTYAVARFGVEFLRGDLGRGFVLDGLLSTSQLISILVVAVSLAMLRHCARIQKSSPPPSPSASVST